MMSDMKKEAVILMRLRNANIVTLMGIVLDPGCQGLVLEYLKHGSLEQFLENIRSNF